MAPDIISEAKKVCVRSRWCILHGYIKRRFFTGKSGPCRAIFRCIWKVEEISPYTFHFRREPTPCGKGVVCLIVVKLVPPIGYEPFTVLLKCGLFILDGVEKCLRVRDIHGTEDKVVEPPDIP